VNINATPWARISLDGESLGVTPLGIRVPPGPHTFAAVFPDGSRIEQLVDVQPDNRHVSFVASEARPGQGP